MTDDPLPWEATGEPMDFSDYAKDRARVDSTFRNYEEGVMEFFADEWLKMCRHDKRVPIEVLPFIAEHANELVERTKAERDDRGQTRVVVVEEATAFVQKYKGKVPRGPGPLIPTRKIGH